MNVPMLINEVRAKGIKLWEENGQLKLKGPKGALSDAIREQLLSQKSAVIAFLSQASGARRVAQIRPIERGSFERLPLSFAQERLWFINELEPNGAVYNCPAAVTISGALDIEQLEEAFRRVIARHESLRTVFLSEEGRAHQVILEHVDFRLQRIDVSGFDEAQRDTEARRICQAESVSPFDLTKGPLIRGKVIKVSPGVHILMLNMHHIVSDGWSIGVLVKELSLNLQALSRGEAVLPALPIQYVDYSVWQRKRLEEDGILSRQLGYWKSKLSGITEILDVATDYPRPAERSFDGRTKSFTLDAPLSAALKTLAESQSCTLYMVLLAAFDVLLHRYTGQEDICVGSPIANRHYGETEELIGVFVNTLALRSHVKGAEPFTELLSQVKRTCLEGYENQDAPFEKVVEAVQTQRSLATSPLFQVMFVLQNTDLGTLEHSIRPYPLHNGTSKFDLSLEVAEAGEGLAATIEYSTALYKSQTIERMAEHFTSLCRAITAAPAVPIKDLNFLGGAEARRVLHDFNATAADYPKSRCIHEFFEEQVRRTPAATAVVFGELKLSYQELHDRSHDLALYLQAHGVVPDTVVGLCAERSLEMLVAIMGIELAGGAYLPLDPDYPEDRLGYMLQDSAAAIVLTQEKFKEKAGALVGRGVALVCLDTQWRDIALAAADLQAQHVELRHDVRSHHLSYVIYTSGSTGKPKGVMVEHQALVNRIIWMQEAYSLTPSDVVLQKTPYSFDVSVWEFFWPMMSGASIVFAVPRGHMDVDYLERTIIESEVTTLHFVPSMLTTYLDHAEKRCPQVRQVFCSGEALDRRSVDRYRDRFINAALLNLYGPTEAAIDVTAYDCAQLRYPFVPIGAPIANTQIYILDRYDNPQPLGVPGELHIAGDGLARGYLNRPELTEQRFVANPFRPGHRMYKTGDLARWLEDGNIEYLGRIDTQVKIRGFRIELGEIEAQLGQHPEVAECVVVAQGREANKQLVAFYRARASTAEQSVPLESESLRSHLRLTLPDHMIPAAFVSLATLPLTASGKADRRVLERRGVEFVSNRQYLAPRSGTEMQIAGIFAEILKIRPEKIGVNDNFFELGGHSLLAMQVISKVRQIFDVELPLKALFEDGTVGTVAEKIAAMREPGQASSARRVAQIRPVERASFERLPLSFAQERLWFINEMEPNSGGYNCPCAVKIHGELPIDRLEEAFRRVIERHENLRTVFPSEDGQAHQHILQRMDFRLQRVDLSAHERTQRESEAKRLCQEAAATPFDMARGPLIRGSVITLAADEHILMLNMHHIVSDGWSLGVLVKELSVNMEALRRGEAADLPALPIQYVDYSVWQRKRLEEGGVLKRQLSYWTEKLKGVAESLDLATDYPRPAERSVAGRTQAFALDALLTAQLRSLAERQGCTLYMVLLAAFKALLYRYTGQEDICLGSAIANRQYGETEELIGMFVNTLALRTQVRGSDAFTDLLSRVKRTCLEGYENQDAPFEKVVEAMQLRRSLAISPLFQVMFVLQNAQMGVRGPHIEPYPLQNGISKFDLSVEFTEVAEGLAGAIEYSTALFKDHTIERMTRHFATLCRAITAAPSTSIRDLQFMEPEERRQLLMDFNATAAAYPAERCIHELFAEQARLNPEKTAVVFGEQSLSYRQLYERSQDLALYLQSQGVGPDSLVGLCMERSLDMLVGMFGILQAGGAYVPLDPEYPEDRLAYMLEDSQALLVLTQQDLTGKLRALSTRATRLLALDAEWPQIAARVAHLKRSAVQLRREVKPHHLAYVIYTSGSTGKPKGVLIEHHSVVSLIHWVGSVYSPQELAGVLASASICFDFSVFEIFPTLALGGQVIMAANALAVIDVSNQKSITSINMVPSAIEELSKMNAIPAAVQTINLGAEPLSASLVNRLYDTTSVRKVYDLYGPSEYTVLSTYQLRQRRGRQTIGRPIANTQIHILDGHNNVQAIGVPGELHVAGAGIARGYLNRAELTLQKFVANPFAPGTRMYKTGDRARWLEDGTIEYLGRMDTQVKIRGFRIELGEIENRLNEHEHIEDAVVVAQGADGQRQLVAFYRTTDGTAERPLTLPAEELRNHLRRTLPAYMVPAAFVRLATIPSTPNGKTDRRALEGMDAAVQSSRVYVAARNPTEVQLVKIWAQVLNLAPDKIGIHDDFFELGGHSLLAVQLMARINRRFGQLIPLATLFSAASVEALSKTIEKRDVGRFDVLVRMQSDGDGIPFFAIPGAGGNVLSLRPLSQALGTSQPFYGVQASGLDGKTTPSGSVEETAAVNIAALMSVQKRGPYRLIGHSYGGLVALEMARILLLREERVASLVLLDSVAPTADPESAPPQDNAALLLDWCAALAEQYAVKLDLDADVLRSLGPSQSSEHLVGAARRAGLDVTAEQVDIFQNVLHAHTGCARAYSPAPLPGVIDATLFRAVENRNATPVMGGDYGWNRLLVNPIRIQDVSADHFSMLAPPHVLHIAREILGNQSGS